MFSSVRNPYQHGGASHHPFPVLYSLIGCLVTFLGIMAMTSKGLVNRRRHNRMLVRRRVVQETPVNTATVESNHNDNNAPTMNSLRTPSTTSQPPRNNWYSSETAFTYWDDSSNPLDLISDRFGAAAEEAGDWIHENAKGLLGEELTDSVGGLVDNGLDWLDKSWMMEQKKEENDDFKDADLDDDGDDDDDDNLEESNDNEGIEEENEDNKAEEGNDDGIEQSNDGGETEEENTQQGEGNDSEDEAKTNHLSQQDAEGRQQNGEQSFADHESSREFVEDSKGEENGSFDKEHQIDVAPDRSAFPVHGQTGAVEEGKPLFAKLSREGIEHQVVAQT